MTRLALFDFDHTLRRGGSEPQWGEFLMDEGLRDRAHRVLTELTTQHRQIDDLIVEVAHNMCPGRTSGTLNMREGQVERLHDWLQGQGLPRTLMAEALFYSDSSDELPMVSAVGGPVIVDHDATLRARAIAAGWKIGPLVR